MSAIQRVLKSGQFIMGSIVKAFEEEVADYLGVKQAIGVDFGTDALLLRQALLTEAEPLGRNNH